MTSEATTVRRLPLLSQMADDMDRHGSLHSSTAAAMWTAYTAHTALTGAALAQRSLPLPIPPVVARVVGSALVAAGAALCVAGMGRFTGVQELTGTRNQPLLTTGIYQDSRNPQYLGYLVALAGAGVARRSGAALASTAALAAVYRAWIPVEEAHLAELYGQSYTDYARRTRRWLGRRS